MKKFTKYELTQEEKDILLKCYDEVAVGCGCDCKGCPFSLDDDDNGCILERLKEIVDESE